MKPEDKIKELIRKSEATSGPETDQRILGDSLEYLSRLEQHRSAASEPNIWRTIMKSKTIRFAAAAVIIVAVLAGMYHFGNPVESVAIADIVQPFLTARTATFKITIEGQGVPSQEFDGMFMAPCRMRHTQPGGGTVIVDLERGKFITLIPQAKQAVVLELTNVPDEPGSLNFFQEIRARILKAQPLDDESVEFLGEQQIDGQSAIGYHIQKPGLNGTIWANAKTKIPLRIEITEEPMTITMSNIVFDVELDESLFSLDVPEGYRVTILQRDMSEPTEASFIEAMKIWAEHMDGGFPSKMERSAMNEFVKYQQEKSKQKGAEPSLDDITALQQVMIDMTEGFPFVESLPAGSDWHYAGQDVKFGDAGKAIFWYKPAGSQTYRVIYGDLSVKDLPPQELPK